MKIFGSPLSPFVARLILACDHKGIKYTCEMPEGGLRTPEYLKLNPFGKIPTIKDGATVLFESGVILPYLDDKFPKKKIIPASAAAAGKARLIASVTDQYVQEPALALFRQIVGRAPKDKAAADKALADMEAGLEIVNGFMKPGGPCATGNSFTIADCYLIPALLFVTAAAPLFGLKDPLKGRPNVKKYWAAMKKHPSAQAHMAETQKIMKARLKTV